MVSRFARRGDLTLMNYGYAVLKESDDGVHLSSGDEENRYPIQLYHRVAGAVDLSGKDVLEVGCGRGGGSAFVMQYFKPRSLTGVDLARRAITFCRREYRIDGLSFFQADAESLPFPSASFDVVLNVESSHSYPSLERFLGEVARVLRPGGYLLWADHRPATLFKTVRRQFEAAGLVARQKERIDANVVRSLELDSPRKRAAIQRQIPLMLRTAVAEFAGVEGSELHQGLKSGDLQYWRFALQKAV